MSPVRPHVPDSPKTLASDLLYTPVRHAIDISPGNARRSAYMELQNCRVSVLPFRSSHLEVMFTIAYSA